MKNVKNRSRIFLCADGKSNLDIDSLEKNKDKNYEFYTKIENMAKEKVFYLINYFWWLRKWIYVFKNMVELSWEKLLESILLKSLKDSKIY